MLPAEERQAQTSGSGLSVLFMDVPLFATELTEVRIESQPDITSAGEQPQPLCRDFKRRIVNRGAARIRIPRAPHSVTPLVGEMRVNTGETVEHQ